MNLPSLDAIDPTVVLLLVPVVLLQVGLLIAAIADLIRDDRAVRGGNKGAWAVIIVLVNLVGPVLYFLVGRVDGPPPDTSPAPGSVPGWGSPHDPPIAPAPAGNRSPTPRPGTVADPAANAPLAAHAPLPDGRPVIVIEGLTRRYPGGVLALDGLSMTVPHGSVFGLLGPNGAGKTTTLRILAGLTRATGGRSSIGGVDVAVDPIGVRRRLGYLEQDPRAYGWMTGREQLALLGRLHGLDGSALDRAIEDALRRVDLAGAAGRRTATYSGGMRQRLGIAGALVHRPPVIILDEPASSLDPEGRRDVLELIVSLRGDSTVLFSTHVLADVERICDRVAILNHGRLVAEDALPALLERYAQPVWRIEPEPGQAPATAILADRLRGERWVTAVTVDHGLVTVAVSDSEMASSSLLGAVAEAGLAVVSVARARPTLEDVFLQLTGEGAGDASGQAA